MQPPSLFHFRTFCISSKRKPISISGRSLPPNPSAPDHHKPAFSLSGFACSGQFIHWESCNRWSFVTGFFFLSMCCCQGCGLSRLWFVSGLPSFEWLSNMGLLLEKNGGRVGGCQVEGRQEKSWGFNGGWFPLSHVPSECPL